MNFELEKDEEIDAVQALATKGVCSDCGESTLTPEIIFCPGCGSANLAASPIVAYYCIAEVDCNTLCHYQDKYCLSCRYELPGDAMKL